METKTNSTPGTGETLGVLAARYPAASRVFRSVGLDYCCGGKQSLMAACAEKQLDPEVLLQSIVEEKPAPDADWEHRPLAALVQHIIERYHEPLRRDLPELCRMAETVEEKHAGKPACPRGLTEHLTLVHEAVLSHLEKEEQILFPMILAGRGAHAAGPIQVMELEHEDHGANLARTRALARDLIAPADACPTWQALYLRLGELEAELMDHIHLENHVLFPRALYE